MEADGDPIPPPWMLPGGDKTSGPVLLTILLNSGLLGVLSVQVFLYYFAFPNDRAYIKCLVYGIYILEFIQSVLIIQDGFRIFVTSFGDIIAIDQVGTTWLSVPILTAIATSTVQGFYAHRISILARSKKLLGVIIVLSFIQLGGGIAVGFQVRQTKYYSVLISLNDTPGKLSFIQPDGGILVGDQVQQNDVAHPPPLVVRANASIGIWHVGGVLCDLIIAVCMSYYLSQQDDVTKKTKAIINKIIRLTIETGSLTAVVGIVSFALAMQPYTIYYQTPMGVIGKVYANSMLVLINSRMLLQTGSEETIISGVKFATMPANNKDSTIEAHNGDVTLDTEAHAEPSGSSEEGR